MMERAVAIGHEAQTARGAVFLFGDHPRVRTALRTSLTHLGYEVSEFDTIEELCNGLHRQPAPVAVLLERGDSEELFRALDDLASLARPVPVVAVSEDSPPEKIVRAAHLGAASFLGHPFSTRELERALETAVADRPKGVFAPARRTPAAPPRGFVYASPKMRPLVEMARRVAESDITILIRGESGSGKEVIARYVHTCSTRAPGAFVKVNCAALPEELLESELFGYEKGAFTGAIGTKPGKFEAANDGTIFLDEITETSGRLQAKLLHVLQDKRVVRLGGNREIGLDVRILAATNTDLEREVEEGRFREDLYFRLKVIDLHVPPLRERREEIPVLLDHFLRTYAQQYRRPIPDLSEKALNLLTNHRWTGNVRELENMTKRLVILGDERLVVQELLGKSEYARSYSGVRGGASGVAVHPPASDTAPVEPELSLKKVAERAALAAEKDLILTTLERTHWNRVRASRLLGVSYKTLLTKMKKCGLSEA